MLEANASHPADTRTRDFEQSRAGDDHTFPVSAAEIQSEIDIAMRRPLTVEMLDFVLRYGEVGERNPYLWRWCRQGVEITTLPCVAAEFRGHLGDTKLLGVMFDVLLDDVADQQQDSEFLEHLLEIPLAGGSASSRRLNAHQQRYARLAEDVWSAVMQRVRQYPRFAEYQDLLRYDYQQLFNVMRYAQLINRLPAAMNMAEHDLYFPHNMHMMVSATMDLMCSPKFDSLELGGLREVLLHAQHMGRIGNLITTWERELAEGDFTSGVFVRAVQTGDLTWDELRSGDHELIRTRIHQGDHERYFLNRWRWHRERLLALQPRIRSCDVGQVASGLERLIRLHLGSRGDK